MNIVNITSYIRLELCVSQHQREEVLKEITAVLEQWAETTKLSFDLRVDRSNKSLE